MQDIVSMLHVYNMHFLYPSADTREILQTHLTEVCHILIKNELFQKKMT